MNEGPPGTLDDGVPANEGPPGMVTPSGIACVPRVQSEEE
jgi:hypothetical protein